MTKTFSWCQPVGRGIVRPPDLQWGDPLGGEPAAELPSWSVYAAIRLLKMDRHTNPVTLIPA